MIQFQAQPALLQQRNEGTGNFWLGTGTSSCNWGKEGGGNKAGAEEGHLKLVSLQTCSHIKNLLSQVKKPVLMLNKHKVKLAVNPKSK